MGSNTTILIPARIRTDKDRMYLGLAIDSALDQQDTKIIVGLNQCEVDLTTLIKKYEDQVTFLHLSSFNLSSTRNELVKQVVTQYFFFLDHDDLLPENAIAIAEENHPGEGYFVYGKTLLFNDGGSYLYPASPFNPTLLLKQVYFPNGVLQWTKNLDVIGLWDEKLDVIEDMDFWIRAAANCIVGIPIQTLLYKYRTNFSGMVVTNKDTPAWKAANAYIRKKHAHLYAGGMEMACKKCGSDKVKKMKGLDGPAAAPQRMASAPAPITDVPAGMVRVRYLLGTGTTTYFGPVSGKPYIFSAKNNVQLVRAEDVKTESPKKPGFFDMMKYGAHIFEPA